MMSESRTQATVIVGWVLMFLPVALGMVMLSGALPSSAPVQITVVLVIVACAGLGPYLTFWGKRPRRRHGDWLPSDTLPR